MLHAEEVQHRRMEIVNFVAVTDCLVSKIIRLTNAGTALDSGSRHPHRKTKRIVIATISALGKWGPSELAGPNHEGRFE